MTSTQYGRNLTSLVYWTTIHYSAVPLTIVCTKYALTSSVFPTPKGFKTHLFGSNRVYFDVRVILRIHKTFE